MSVETYERQKARIAEMERQLGEERARTSGAFEQVRQAFAARGAPTPGGGFAGILAGIEMLGDRAEQAERERDEWQQRALSRDVENTNLVARAERAEADNAALLEAYRRTWGCVQYDNVLHSPACNASNDPLGVCAPECPALYVANLLKADHPGAALLERHEQTRAALFLAMRYISDRSAGSDEAWEAAAKACGINTDDFDASEVLAALEPKR